MVKSQLSACIVNVKPSMSEGEARSSIMILTSYYFNKLIHNKNINIYNIELALWA